MTRIPDGLQVALCALAMLAGRADAQASPFRVLFVGNSLTYSNDLPASVAAMPCLTDGRTIKAESIVAADTSLDDHVGRGAVAARLRRNRWDLVVLQQGPSALDESRRQLLASVRELTPLIRSAGARPALFMVWPSLQRSDDRDRVSDSYRLAAAAVDAVLLPVGDAWRAALARDPSLRLYGGDGYHPSRLGSELAALVICAAIGGRSPSALVSSSVLARQRRWIDTRDALSGAAQDALATVEPSQRMSTTK